MTEEIQENTLPEDTDNVDAIEELSNIGTDNSEQVEEVDNEKHISIQSPAEQPGNRAHLTSSVPRVARVPKGALTKGEMAEIRNIFGDMDDAEIQRLYKKVTK